MHWIIDTDPGIDDAAAIIAALGLGEMNVCGITAVHGNVGIENTVRNALILVELMGKEIPVYQGASQPILNEPRRASEFHGKDGFGNTYLPDPRKKPERAHAVDFIIEMGKKHKGDLSLLTLGPLTNVGLAVAQDRSLVGSIKKIVMMGGTSRARGNTTPLAEFNIYADPEAAAIVFSSGIPVLMVPWETCVDAMLGPHIIAAVRRSETPVGRAFAKAMEFTVNRLREVVGTEGLILSDLVASACAMDESVIKEKVSAKVLVETGGTYARGLTVIDERLMDGSSPNAEICLACDRDKVGSMLLKALGVEGVSLTNPGGTKK